MKKWIFLAFLDYNFADFFLIVPGSNPEKNSENPRSPIPKKVRDRDRDRDRDQPNPDFFRDSGSGPGLTILDLRQLSAKNQRNLSSFR